MPKPLVIPSSTAALYALCMSLLYAAIACFSPLKETTCFTDVARRKPVSACHIENVVISLCRYSVTECIELTVLMAPSVCSTTFPASPYDVCPLLEILKSIFETIPPATTTGGMHANMTRDKSHPFMNAITKPPMKVAICCWNLPT